MQTADKILITGAAGFIDSALVCELNQRGFHNLILTAVLLFGKDGGKSRGTCDHEIIVPPLSKPV